jgi:broad specificity polyphosphatase/5'/3'-nucleotidase SurE
MRILCTNDDGIHAPGLKIVEQIARELSDDVWIVAPELDQSGVSHSLSLNDPLRLREVGPRHFAVRGTPTDCVIMGARHILGDKMPDIVLSGVNKGRNVAEDVRRDGRGNPYFWIGFDRAAVLETPAEGSDLAALAARYVSVTPLRLDRTDEGFSATLTDTLK